MCACASRLALGRIRQHLGSANQIRRALAVGPHASRAGNSNYTAAPDSSAVATAYSATATMAATVVAIANTISSGATTAAVAPRATRGAAAAVPLVARSAFSRDVRSCLGRRGWVDAQDVGSVPVSAAATRNSGLLECASRLNACTSRCIALLCGRAFWRTLPFKLVQWQPRHSWNAGSNLQWRRACAPRIRRDDRYLLRCAACNEHRPGWRQLGTCRVACPRHSTR